MPSRYTQPLVLVATNNSPNVLQADDGFDSTLIRRKDDFRFDTRNIFPREQDYFPCLWVREGYVQLFTALSLVTTQTGNNYLPALAKRLKRRYKNELTAANWYFGLRLALLNLPIDNQNQDKMFPELPAGQTTRQIMIPNLFYDPKCKLPGRFKDSKEFRTVNIEEVIKSLEQEIGCRRKIQAMRR